MPNFILRTNVEQYVVPMQVKASELAAAIKDEDGELSVDYKGYQGEWFYEADNPASRKRAFKALLADTITWFRERGADVARDDRLHLMQEDHLKHDKT